jgi:hypothetical protein
MRNFALIVFQIIVNHTESLLTVGLLSCINILVRKASLLVQTRGFIIEAFNVATCFASAIRKLKCEVHIHSS